MKKKIDCVVAGFLAARLKGSPAKEALTIAVATGACNVEEIDSLSGIPSWEKLQLRLNRGWEKHKPQF